MIFMKESYVHLYQWVSCSSGNCGYERCAADSSYMIRNKPVLLRMFKVNGQQTCEGCIKESIDEMKSWLGKE